jgi:FMN reductase
VVAFVEGRISLELDLIDVASQLFEWPNDDVAALNAQVAASDVLVVASPTYKATYTGLLKAFLDRYPNNGLAGVTAVPVMTGASTLHSMAIDHGLRPLLVELGATVPTRGLYFLTPNIADLDEVVDDWAAQHLHNSGLFGAKPVEESR